MRNIFWIVALVAIFFVSEGCKEDSRVGFDLIRNDQSLSSGADTIWAVNTQPIGEDTIRTDYSKSVSLGIVQDPIFGKTTAEFAVQFNLGGSLPFREKDSTLIEETGKYKYFYHAFGKAPKADSMFVILAYDTTAHTTAHTRANTMGDLTLVQQLEVRLLNDTLAPTNYAHTEIAPLLAEKATHSLGTAEHKFTPADLTYEFKVDNQQFVDTFLNNNTVAFSSKDNFVESKLKGLAFLNNSSDPSFLCRFLLDSGTKLRIYYTNEAIKDKDTTVYYDFKVDLATNRALAYTRYFTEIKHDYTGSELEGKVDAAQTEDNGKVYIQSLGGVRSLITFPGIKEWAKGEENKNKLIRNAQLIIRPIENDYSDFQPTLEKLSIYKMLEDKQMGWLSEYFIISDRIRDDVSEEYDPVDNEFRFDITSYVNELKASPELEEKGLVLTAEDRHLTFGRTTLHSAASSNKDYRMFVKISYSYAE